MAYLLKRHRCDLVCVHLSQSRSHSHMSVPPKWDHILCAQLLPTREVQVPPLRKPRILLVQILVQELVLFLNREPLFFFLWSKFGQPKPDGLGYIDTVDSDLMHHQYRLSVLQWNPGPARKHRHPTRNNPLFSTRKPFRVRHSKKPFCVQLEKNPSLYHTQKP